MHGNYPFRIIGPGPGNSRADTAQEADIVFIQVDKGPVGNAYPRPASGDGPAQVGPYLRGYLLPGAADDFDATPGPADKIGCRRSHPRGFTNGTQEHFFGPDDLLRPALAPKDTASGFQGRSFGGQDRKLKAQLPGLLLQPGSP
ncbi:hypothetical protein MTAT_30180 [Moorella thermoacetica]|uniref:Uncharacterized protein n=1 Tax=Neomoorella thermoacetica TaxID=1525 RepID=A0ABY3N1W1_NEOTH|nr:hypothetical protein MTAT_30180 [Moorella thermoacetica]